MESIVKQLQEEIITLRKENSDLLKELERSNKILNRSDKIQKRNYDALFKKYEEIKQLKEEVIQTQSEILLTMGNICESRSKETANHVSRVALYSEILAEKIGLGKHHSDLIKRASPMHDIGKVAIPDEILKKEDSLNEEESRIMQTHVIHGYELLKTSDKPLLQVAAKIAYEHHEKYDGTGYPRQLAGKAISVEGRITALADVFDALSSERCYKDAWNDKKTYAYINEQSGKHFDPDLVDVFFNNLALF
jgi:putative nucleotidyltransferase with HDIG domain